MRKVLAQASVGPEHKELVLKDLKSIFKRIKIPLDILLQDENYQQEPNNQPLFKSYPYITLTIPNYEQHRDYLEKVYKSNVLFSKFILLISKGDSYEDLIRFRNEEILREHCRNWNNSVSCTFDSAPVFTDLQEQVSRVDQILGGMDIRGKISQIDAQKKFHLIQDHWPRADDPHPDVKPPGKKTLLKLFFGLELGRSGRTARGGITIAADSRYSCASEFVEYEEETADESDMCDDNQEGIIIQEEKILGFGGLGERVVRKERAGVVKVKINAERRQAKRRSQQVLAEKNPYLKKQYPCEVVLSQSAMVEE